MFRKKIRCPDSKLIFLFGLACGVISVSLFFAAALMITSKNMPRTKKILTSASRMLPKGKKIKVELFDDFECPFCLRHSKTIDQMLEEYGGKIELTLKHLPLNFHPNAQKAAEAYECAKEQSKGWEMHDKIFEASENKNMSVDTWKSAAKQLGLGASQFDDCLDGGKYADKIKQDAAEARQRGVSGVPATFINGEMVKGAAPYETIKDAIEKNLK